MQDVSQPRANVRQDHQGRGHQEAWFVGTCPHVSLPVILLDVLIVLFTSHMFAQLTLRTLDLPLAAQCAARRDELGVRLLRARTSRSFPVMEPTLC